LGGNLARALKGLEGERRLHLVAQPARGEYVRTVQTRPILLARTLAVSFGAALLAYGLELQPWMRGWGATIVEQTRTLPGDELVPEAGVQITQAVTIAAPLEEVRPWLARAGQDRGGFYSYEYSRALGPASRGALLAEPAGDRASRLIARTRIPTGLASLAYAAVEVPHFVMQRKLLLGIRARAEADTRPI
jgi:hypothetical protein